MIAAPIRQHFDSLADYAAVKPSAQNAERLACSLEKHAGERSWFGVESADAVRAAVAQGWPEGVERTLGALHALKVRRATSIRRKRVRGSHGDELDMQRVYRGDLANAWERCQRREVSASPVQTLYVDICENYEVTAGTLFWRGAAALIVADALTQAGYALEIIAGMHVIELPGTVHHTITVKASSAPLDLHALAATLCLAGYFRVFGFTGLCSVPYKVHRSLGQSYHPAQPGVIAGLERCTNAARAQAWIDATLKPFSEGGNQ